MYIVRGRCTLYVEIEYHYSIKKQAPGVIFYILYFELVLYPLHIFGTHVAYCYGANKGHDVAVHIACQLFYFFEMLLRCFQHQETTLSFFYLACFGRPKVSRFQTGKNIKTNSKALHERLAADLLSFLARIAINENPKKFHVRLTRLSTAP